MAKGQRKNKPYADTWKTNYFILFEVCGHVIIKSRADQISFPLVLF